MIGSRPVVRAVGALFDRGCQAVRTGTHERDSRPAPGGRWGVAVVLRPDADCRRRLHQAAAAADLAAGGGHWRTGASATVHVTVRALDGHRPSLRRDEPVRRRWSAAVTRAARMCSTVPVRFIGVNLTPAGVIACVQPDGPAMDRFAAVLGDELGVDGWLEAGRPRDLWYATLVHFTGPIPEPDRLIDWVTARHATDLGACEIRDARLINWRFVDRPRLATITAARFGTG